MNLLGSQRNFNGFLATTVTYDCFFYYLSNPSVLSRPVSNSNAAGKARHRGGPQFKFDGLACALSREAFCSARRWKRSSRDWGRKLQEKPSWRHLFKKLHLNGGILWVFATGQGGGKVYLRKVSSFRFWIHSDCPVLQLRVSTGQNAITHGRPSTSYGKLWVLEPLRFFPLVAWLGPRLFAS